MTDTASVLTPTVYIADDDDCVRTTTIPSPVCETNPGVRPTIRRNLIAIRNTLKVQHNMDIGVTSTTGLTANAIKGTTIHSALNLPIGSHRYTALRSQSLMNLQTK